MTNEQLAKHAIEQMWNLLGDNTLSGLTPYQAAKKLGLGDASAKIVQTLWNGPNPLP